MMDGFQAEFSRSCQDVSHGGEIFGGNDRFFQGSDTRADTRADTSFPLRLCACLRHRERCYFQGGLAGEELKQIS
jgi:hypothetical protein